MYMLTGSPLMVGLLNFAGFLPILLFSLFTAAAGLTSDPVSFSAMRFLAGLGIGGVMP